MDLFHTPRLIVRQFEAEDAEALFRVNSNPTVVKWMGDGSLLSYEQCVKWIQVSQRNYQTKGFGASAIIAKETGHFIGFCGIIYDPDRTDPLPEIIYAFEPPWWGEGLASELVPALLKYGLETCGLLCILATIDKRNLASQRVVEKANMRLEGEEVEPDGEITLVYTLSK